MAEAELPVEVKKLTDKESKFVDEYCIRCNAAKAARDAGYSAKTAREIGYENLTKPHIRAAIDNKLKQMSLSAEETTKLIVDIAKASLNSYIKTKKVERIPQKRVGLAIIIANLKEEIEFEEEFAIAAGFVEEEKGKHDAQQARRHLRLLRLQMILKKNPNATDLIDGEPEEVEEADFDLVALSKDQEAGRIKSIKHTEHGLQVELYAADAALRDVARMHGLFEKDNKQTQPVIPVTPQINVYTSGPPLASNESEIED